MQISDASCYLSFLTAILLYPAERREARVTFLNFFPSVLSQKQIGIFLQKLAELEHSR